MKSYAKEIAQCLRMYIYYHELSDEFCQHKPEWNDEKSLNEVFCSMTQYIEMEAE